MLYLCNVKSIFNLFREKMNTQEMLEYGLKVFNNEETKFQSWLDKPNISLNNKTPRFLLLSDKGCKEVLQCLNRIEYGNYA